MTDFEVFIKTNGIKKKDIAAYLGVSNAFITQLASGACEIPYEKLKKIKENPSWDASMLSDAAADAVSAVKELSEKSIPLIPADAMAGYLSGNSQTVMGYECERYAVPIFKGAEFLIHVKGDSMQPRYLSGDIVACKKLPLDTFFQWNRTYVIDSEQGVLIKKVKQGSDGAHILLVSENSDYAPFELRRDQIYSLGLVVGLIRAE